MIVSPLESITALLTPLECHICKAEGNMLCHECTQKVLPELISRCYLCNKLTKQQRVCTSCRSRSSLRRVWWLSAYSGTTKELIHQMKYQRKRTYAREFGLLLAETLPYLPEATLVVPAPTAPSRIRQRGFDQAHLIAASFAKHKCLPCKQFLYRTSQVDQIGKNRAERKRQIEDSLAMMQVTDLNGKSVLLIDDVLTTGATLESAARLLRDNGADHVDAAVIARHLLG
mgnify:CR=1 FL=1